MRKRYFVFVVISRNRPVRAPTVNGCLCFTVKSMLSRGLPDGASQCDNNANIKQVTYVILKRWNVTAFSHMHVPVWK